MQEEKRKKTRSKVRRVVVDKVGHPLAFLRGQTVGTSADRPGTIALFLVSELPGLQAYLDVDVEHRGGREPLDQPRGCAQRGQTVCPCPGVGSCVLGQDRRLPVHLSWIV